eukprot:1336510-Rhodomonas_salina.2
MVVKGQRSHQSRSKVKRSKGHMSHRPETKNNERSAILVTNGQFGEKRPKRPKRSKVKGQRSKVKRSKVTVKGQRSQSGQRSNLDVDLHRGAALVRRLQVVAHA